MAALQPTHTNPRLLHVQRGPPTVSRHVSSDPVRSSGVAASFDVCTNAGRSGGHYAAHEQSESSFDSDGGSRHDPRHCLACRRPDDPGASGRNAEPHRRRQQGCDRGRCESREAPRRIRRVRREPVVGRSGGKGRHPHGRRDCRVRWRAGSQQRGIAEAGSGDAGGSFGEGRPRAWWQADGGGRHDRYEPERARFQFPDPNARKPARGAAVVAGPPHARLVLLLPAIDAAAVRLGARAARHRAAGADASTRRVLQDEGRSAGFERWGRIARVEGGDKGRRHHHVDRRPGSDARRGRDECRARQARRRGGGARHLARRQATDDQGHCRRDAEWRLDNPEVRRGLFNSPFRL